MGASNIARTEAFGPLGLCTPVIDAGPVGGVRPMVDEDRLIPIREPWLLPLVESIEV